MSIGNEHRDVTNMWVSSYNLLAIQFKDESKHTMCGGMLWTLHRMLALNDLLGEVQS